MQQHPVKKQSVWEQIDWSWQICLSSAVFAMTENELLSGRSGGRQFLTSSTPASGTSPNHANCLSFSSGFNLDGIRYCDSDTKLGLSEDDVVGEGDIDGEEGFNSASSSPLNLELLPKRQQVQYKLKLWQYAAL